MQGKICFRLTPIYHEGKPSSWSKNHSVHICKNHINRMQSPSSSYMGCWCQSCTPTIWKIVNQESSHDLIFVRFWVIFWRVPWITQANLPHICLRRLIESNVVCPHTNLPGNDVPNYWSSLYCTYEDEQLVCINSSYVAELFWAAADECQTQLNATLEIFETTWNEQPIFILAGMLFTEAEDTLNIDLDFYLTNLTKPPMILNSRSLSLMWMKLAWLANTWPDLVFDIPQTVQVALCMSKYAPTVGLF